MSKIIKELLALGYVSVTNMDWSELRVIKYASFWSLHLFWFSIYPILHKSSLIVNNTVNVTFKFLPIEVKTIEIEMPFSMLILYIGSLCIVWANIIYYVRCPKVIKLYQHYSEFKCTGMNLGYLEHMASKDHAPQSELVKVLRNIPFDEPEHSKEKKFTEVYLGSIELYKKSRRMSGILFALGFLSIAFIGVQNIFYVFFW